jgi:hypothetical protein
VRHPRARGLVCAAVLLGALRHGQAQSNAEKRAFDVALEYAPFPECPEEAELKDIVTGRLRYDPFREEAPNRVFVSIGLRNGALEGRVEWRDRAGNWTGDQAFPSQAADCRELVRTLGFALAVQIHLLAVQDGFEPPSSAAPPDGEATTSAATQPRDLVKPSRAADESHSPGGKRSFPGHVRGSRATFSLGAGASIGGGLASSVIPLARLFGRVDWPYASLELGGEVSAPSTTRRSDGAGFSQHALLVTAAGCGTRDPWSLCVLAKGGVVRVEGRDVDVPASRSGSIFLTGLRAGARQRLGSAAYLELRAEGLVNVTRWTVTLDQLPVWMAPRFVETLGLDLGAFFP